MIVRSHTEIESFSTPTSGTIGMGAYSGSRDGSPMPSQLSTQRRETERIETPRDDDDKGRKRRSFSLTPVSFRRRARDPSVDRSRPNSIAIGPSASTSNNADPSTRRFSFSLFRGSQSARNTPAEERGELDFITTASAALTTIPISKPQPQMPTDAVPSPPTAAVGARRRLRGLRSRSGSRERKVQTWYGGQQFPDATTPAPFTAAEALRSHPPNAGLGHSPISPIDASLRGWSGPYPDVMASRALRRRTSSGDMRGSNVNAVGRRQRTLSYGDSPGEAVSSQMQGKKMEPSLSHQYKKSLGVDWEEPPSGDVTNSDAIMYATKQVNRGEQQQQQQQQPPRTPTESQQRSSSMAAAMAGMHPERLGILPSPARTAFTASQVSLVPSLHGAAQQLQQSQQSQQSSQQGNSPVSPASPSSPSIPRKRGNSLGTVHPPLPDDAQERILLQSIVRHSTLPLKSPKRKKVPNEPAGDTGTTLSAAVYQGKGKERADGNLGEGAAGDGHEYIEQHDLEDQSQEIGDHNVADGVGKAITTVEDTKSQANIRSFDTDDVAIVPEAMGDVSPLLGPEHFDTAQSASPHTGKIFLLPPLEDQAGDVSPLLPPQNEFRGIPEDVNSGHFAILESASEERAGDVSPILKGQNEAPGTSDPHSCSASDALEMREERNVSVVSPVEALHSGPQPPMRRPESSTRNAGTGMGMGMGMGTAKQTNASNFPPSEPDEGHQNPTLAHHSQAAEAPQPQHTRAVDGLYVYPSTIQQARAAGSRDGDDDGLIKPDALHPLSHLQPLAYKSPSASQFDDSDGETASTSTGTTANVSNFKDGTGAASTSLASLRGESFRSNEHGHPRPSPRSPSTSLQHPHAPDSNGSGHMDLTKSTHPLRPVVTMATEKPVSDARRGLPDARPQLGEAAAKPTGPGTAGKLEPVVVKEKELRHRLAELDPNDPLMRTIGQGDVSPVSERFDESDINNRDHANDQPDGPAVPGPAVRRDINSPASSAVQHSAVSVTKSNSLSYPPETPLSPDGHILIGASPATIGSQTNLLEKELPPVPAEGEQHRKQTAQPEPQPSANRYSNPYFMVQPQIQTNVRNESSNKRFSIQDTPMEMRGTPISKQRVLSAGRDQHAEYASKRFSMESWERVSGSTTSPDEKAGGVVEYVDEVESSPENTSHVHQNPRSELVPPPIDIGAPAPADPVPNALQRISPTSASMLTSTSEVKRSKSVLQALSNAVVSPGYGEFYAVRVVGSPQMESFDDADLSPRREEPGLDNDENDDTLVAPEPPDYEGAGYGDVQFEDSPRSLHKLKGSHIVVSEQEVEPDHEEHPALRREPIRSPTSMSDDDLYEDDGAAMPPPSHEIHEQLVSGKIPPPVQIQSPRDQTAPAQAQPSDKAQRTNELRLDEPPRAPWLDSGSNRNSATSAASGLSFVRPPQDETGVPQDSITVVQNHSASHDSTNLVPIRDSVQAGFLFSPEKDKTPELQQAEAVTLQRYNPNQQPKPPAIAGRRVSGSAPPPNMDRLEHLHQTRQVEPDVVYGSTAQQAPAKQYSNPLEAQAMMNPQRQINDPRIPSSGYRPQGSGPGTIPRKTGPTPVFSANRAAQTPSPNPAAVSANSGQSRQNLGLPAQPQRTVSADSTVGDLLSDKATPSDSGKKKGRFNSATNIFAKGHKRSDSAGGDSAVSSLHDNASTTGVASNSRPDLRYPSTPQPGPGMGMIPPSAASSELLKPNQMLNGDVHRSSSAALTPDSTKKKRFSGLGGKIGANVGHLFKRSESNGHQPKEKDRKKEKFQGTKMMYLPTVQDASPPTRPSQPTMQRPTMPQPSSSGPGNTVNMGNYVPMQNTYQQHPGILTPPPNEAGKLSQPPPPPSSSQPGSKLQTYYGLPDTGRTEPSRGPPPGGYYAPSWSKGYGTNTMSGGPPLGDNKKPSPSPSGNSSTSAVDIAVANSREARLQVTPPQVSPPQQQSPFRQPPPPPQQQQQQSTTQQQRSFASLEPSRRESPFRQQQVVSPPPRKPVQNIESEPPPAQNQNGPAGGTVSGRGPGGTYQYLPPKETQKPPEQQWTDAWRRHSEDHGQRKPSSPPANQGHPRTWSMDSDGNHLSPQISAPSSELQKTETSNSLPVVSPVTSNTDIPSQGHAANNQPQLPSLSLSQTKPYARKQQPRMGSISESVDQHQERPFMLTLPSNESDSDSDHSRRFESRSRNVDRPVLDTIIQSPPESATSSKPDTRPGESTSPTQSPRKPSPAPAVQAPDSKRQSRDSPPLLPLQVPEGKPISPPQPSPGRQGLPQLKLQTQPSLPTESHKAQQTASTATGTSSSNSASKTSSHPASPLQHYREIRPLGSPQQLAPPSSPIGSPYSSHPASKFPIRSSNPTSSAAANQSKPLQPHPLRTTNLSRNSSAAGPSSAVSTRTNPANFPLPTSPTGNISSPINPIASSFRDPPPPGVTYGSPQYSAMYGGRSHDVPEGVVELPVRAPGEVDDDEEPVMHATSYPGMAWEPRWDEY
jgi:hypothetical protein